MLETVSTTIIMVASGVLLVLWFRSACLLILVAKPARDYARGVAVANQLSFRKVQEILCEPEAGDFTELKDALNRDFRVVRYLLEHTAAGCDSALERGMLRIDYWAMSAWCGVTSR